MQPLHVLLLSPSHMFLVSQLFDLDNSNSIELEEFIAVVSLNDKILGKKRTADEPLELDLGLLSQHLRQYKVIIKKLPVAIQAID